jgi:hypothetical protein
MQDHYYSNTSSSLAQTARIWLAVPLCKRKGQMYLTEIAVKQSKRMHPASGAKPCVTASSPLICTRCPAGQDLTRVRPGSRSDPPFDREIAIRPCLPNGPLLSRAPKCNQLGSVFGGARPATTNSKIHIETSLYHAQWYVASYCTKS